MKNPKTTSLLVGLGLVLVLAYGYAQGNPPRNISINTFINNTGQAVSGLYLQYISSFDFYDTFLVNPPGTVTNVQQDFSGGVSLRLSTGRILTLPP